MGTKRNCKESRFQKQAAKILNDLMRLKMLAWFHVPNEAGWSAPVQWHMKRKSEGLQKGFPDMVVLFPERKMLFMELKATNAKTIRVPKEKKLTEAQRGWKQIIERLGYDYEIIIAKDELDMDKQFWEILGKWGIKL